MRAVRGQRHQLVDRLGALGMVPLAHADQQPAVRSGSRVCVAQTGRNARLRRDGPWLLSGILPIQPLVGEVREEKRGTINEVGSTAVLVDSSPHVVRLRRELIAGSVGGPPDHHNSTALQRLAFQPVDVAGDDVGSGQRDLASGNQ